MSQVSTISLLPEPVRAEINALIRRGATLNEILAWLLDKGHVISRSALGRHGQKYRAAIERIRAAGEFARFIAEDNVERPSTELTEANNLLASQQILEVLLDDGAELEDKLKAIDAAAKLQNAQINNERLKIAARKASGEINTALGKLKAGLFDLIGDAHPDLAAQILALADSLGETR